MARMTGPNCAVMCACLCVSSHRFWISCSLDVPAGVTQDRRKVKQDIFINLPSAGRDLIILARRIQPSFPSSTVKSNFVY